MEKTRDGETHFDFAIDGLDKGVGVKQESAEWNRLDEAAKFLGHVVERLELDRPFGKRRMLLGLLGQCLQLVQHPDVL